MRLKASLGEFNRFTGLDNALRPTWTFFNSISFLFFTRLKLGELVRAFGAKFVAEKLATLNLLLHVSCRSDCNNDRLWVRANF